MTIIKWAEPPASTSGRRTSKTPILDELKKSPGKWALVQEKVNGSAVTGWKRLGCEAVGRKNRSDPKKADVYARWPSNAPIAVPVEEPVQRTKPVSPAGHSATVQPASKPAKATLPLSTDTRNVDPSDADTAYLMSQRQKFEADRNARLNRGGSR